MSDGLLQWVDLAGITHIVVVSPHLDDAAFSTGALLQSRLSSMCRVVTVFSEPAPDSDPAWALAAGFKTVEDEYAARRREDTAAMQQLGVEFEHLGLSPDRWDARCALETTHRLCMRLPAGTGQTLCLLPAGAGGQRLPGRLGLWWRRALRRPAGAPAHPEHCQVRDRLMASLLAAPVVLGFYSEFPYLWNDRTGALRSALTTLAGAPVQHLRLPADARRKESLARAYASQLVPILGASLRYRTTLLARDEEYFVVHG